MTQFTAARLKALLIEHDDGILKSGSHAKDGRDFCAMEFLAKVAGEPWTDNPECVHPALSAYCRRLNDAHWPSDEARTETMLPLLAAVFGTRGLPIKVLNIAEQTIRMIVPIAMEAAAKRNPKHADALRAGGERCKNEGTREAVLAARNLARSAVDAAYAAYAAAAYADAADADADAYAAERIRIYQISIGIVMAEIERARAA